MENMNIELLPEEEIKPIKGYEHLYAITSLVEFGVVDLIDFLKYT